MYAAVKICMCCFSTSSHPLFSSSGPDGEGTSFLQIVTAMYRLMQRHIQEGQNLQSSYLRNLGEERNNR